MRKRLAARIPRQIPSSIVIGLRATLFATSGTIGLFVGCFLSGPREEKTMRTLITASALTLAVFATPALAQTGSGQFCLKGPAGMAQCAYQTMAQCEKARSSGSSSQCVDRSQVQGTVGSGTSSPGGSASPPAAGSNRSSSPQR
jgi:Protein of unknown function (DUF3551)